jgi:SAM-dependent methyltransferase
MTLSTPLFLATDARAYEHFMARWSRRLAGPFLDFAGIKGGNRVLDVGCGTGVITAALAERGCTVVGLDASEPYLEGARRDRSHVQAGRGDLPFRYSKNRRYAGINRASRSLYSIWQMLNTCLTNDDEALQRVWGLVSIDGVAEEWTA